MPGTPGTLLRRGCRIIRQILHEEHVCGIHCGDDAHEVREPRLGDQVKEVHDGASNEREREDVQSAAERSFLREEILCIFSDETDEHAAQDLKLTTESDGVLHRMAESIFKNLITKMAQGKYNHAKAVDAFVYLAEAGAKKYATESIGRPWHIVFPPNVRRAVAAAWRDEFEEEAKMGNYDNFLPKKYRK